VAAVLLMTVNVVPTRSRTPVFPSTAKVAPPMMVTPFAMTSSASELLPVALNV
jgi:hypothetical protein